jgi:hypothetical protein
MVADASASRHLLPQTVGGKVSFNQRTGCEGLKQLDGGLPVDICIGPDGNCANMCVFTALNGKCTLVVTAAIPIGIVNVSIKATNSRAVVFGIFTVHLIA